MSDEQPGGRAGDEGSGDALGRSLQTFSVKVLVGTALAIAVVALVLWWAGRSPPTPPSARVEARSPAGGSAPAPPGRERALPDTAPVSPVAREVERRHAAGGLSEAQKRFERCPGGDVRRLAWIAPQGDIKKLVREREDGVRVEEWYDDAGRLREALVQGRAAAGRWARRITVGDDGREAVEELAGGAVPDSPPPALDRDPAALFFGGPNCAR